VTIDSQKIYLQATNMSETGIPDGMNRNGADSELRDRLVTGRKSKRNRKESDKTVEFAFGDSNKNRRGSVRYDVERPAICFPLTASHEVDGSACLDAIVADVSKHGMLLIRDGAQPFVGLDLMIGVETSIGRLEFAAGRVVASKHHPRGWVEANVRFGGYLDEILQNELIFPVLDRSQMQFGLPYPDAVLASLCKIGAANSEILDTVLVCAHCQALPTIRYGCSLCLSSNLASSKMIHHFACANVDFAEKFETPDGLFCQKCRTRRMIIGSDYEYLDGPKHCGDCGKSNLEAIQIGHCLNCQHRFPMETAACLEIVGYRVNRLDALALIDPH
jgi:hypothetical protein